MYGFDATLAVYQAPGFYGLGPTINPALPADWYDIIVSASRFAALASDDGSAARAPSPLPG